MAKVDLELAIAKALTQGPLRPIELQELQAIDSKAMLVDHSLDYSQMEQVMSWCRREEYRLRAQDKYIRQGDEFAYGGPRGEGERSRGYAGERHGTSHPPLQEAKKLSSRELRALIREEKRKLNRRRR